jgi:hypothetical protein
VWGSRRWSLPTVCCRRMQPGKPTMLVDVGLDAATVTLVSLLWASKEGDGWSAEEEVARDKGIW